MAIPLHKAVSSLESIRSSIETDRQVYRWFLMLITLPALKSKLTAVDGNATQFQRLQTASLIETGLYLAGVVNLIAVFVTKQRLLLLGWILLFWALQKCYAVSRQAVAGLSGRLLTEDFPEGSLNAQTLFQIGEHYAQTYPIPSIVDIITRQDDIARRTLIYANIFACFIYPMGFWYIWLVIVSTFYLMLAAINTSFVFNKLK